MTKSLKIKLQDTNVALSEAQINYEVVQKNIADLVTKKQSVNTHLSKLNEDLIEKDTLLQDKEGERTKLDNNLIETRVNLNSAQKKNNSETDIKIYWSDNVAISTVNLTQS